MYLTKSQQQKIVGKISSPTWASLNWGAPFTLKDTPMSRILRNKTTKALVKLTQEELDRFFDNRDPKEWEVVGAVHDES